MMDTTATRDTATRRVRPPRLVVTTTAVVGTKLLDGGAGEAEALVDIDFDRIPATVH